LSVTCSRSVDFSGYSNFCHKSSNWNIFESGVKHLTPNGQMMDQKFVYVVHNIKHLWVIMWHIFFTSINNTTTILFPTQLWELLYTYHVIKQCTEKETTSLSTHTFAWSEVIDTIECWSCLYCVESVCITCGSEQDTLYKIIYTKMYIWCKTMCLIPHSLPV
jgi:hypothetical protein